MWRKAMLYLGLGPDDEYEEDGLASEPVAPAQQPQAPVAAREPVGRTAAATRTRPAPTRSSVTRAPARAPEAEPEQSTVRTLPPQPQPQLSRPPAQGETVTPKPRPVVRPVPASTTAKPHLVSPTSFNHAQEVADKFKSSQPVVLNLQGAERDLARRLIDFSSGLCYGLGGHMEKVAHQVYLLTPPNVEVSADERRRLQERGLHDA
jgi:cell division inhibitor SepF